MHARKRTRQSMNARDREREETLAPGLLVPECAQKDDDGVVFVSGTSARKKHQQFFTRDGEETDSLHLRDTFETAEARAAIHERKTQPATTEVWQLLSAQYRDIFEFYILPKLNANDLKFLYASNRESRNAIKRSGVALAGAFKICDLESKSTLSWALTRCEEKNKERFCAEMAAKGNVDLLRWLREEKKSPWDETTCLAAALNGRIECLEYAHENGCEFYVDKKVDEYGRLPLHIAAVNANNVNIIHTLVELGADVNKGDDNGLTPVHYAAQENSVDAIRVLHELGGDVNEGDDDGDTPVHYAALENSVDVIRVLHELGGDVSKEDDGGRTPLHSAARKNSADAIRVLHELGADVN